MTTAADGSLNVAVVAGTSPTGIYAASGAINVVQAPVVVGPIGAYHPCGAWWVTTAPAGVPVPARAPDGSLYVCQAPYTTGGRRITVTSGVIT